MSDVSERTRKKYVINDYGRPVDRGPISLLHFNIHRQGGLSFKLRQKLHFRSRLGLEFGLAVVYLGHVRPFERHSQVAGVVNGDGVSRQPGRVQLEGSSRKVSWINVRISLSYSPTQADAIKQIPDLPEIEKDGVTVIAIDAAWSVVDGNGEADRQSEIDRVERLVGTNEGDGAGSWASVRGTDRNEQRCRCELFVQISYK